MRKVTLRWQYGDALRYRLAVQRGFLASLCAGRRRAPIMRRSAAQRL